MFLYYSILKEELFLKINRRLARLFHRFIIAFTLNKRKKHTHPHTHTYVHTLQHTQTHNNRHTHTSIQTHTCTTAHMHIHRWKHVNTYTHTQTHTWVCKSTRRDSRDIDTICGKVTIRIPCGVILHCCFT